jgi:hypothetical protein
MTPGHRAAASRRRQGLPERVADPAVLAQVAGLLINAPDAGSTGSGEAA